MIRPMPFWPSFEPCAKLTPVQVRIRTADPQRRRRGAFRLRDTAPGCAISSFERQQQQRRATNPMSGDISSE